jgi:hypothetical protein
MTPQGYELIIAGTIGALAAALPAVATFILQLRNRKSMQENSSKLDVLHDTAQNVEAKVDVVKTQTNGAHTDMLEAAKKVSFQEGVEWQKAQQAALEEQTRRSTDHKES